MGLGRFIKHVLVPGTITMDFVKNMIDEGDIVKVPFGLDNTVRTGRVEFISYHTRYDVPYDLNRTKFIIDKDIEVIYDTNLYRFDDLYDE